ncbi:MAG: hypothetical protein WCB46_08130 [Methanoregula sp.]
MEYGWEEIVVDTFGFTVVDVLVATVVDAFVAIVVDAFVVTTVVGTRVGVSSTGTVVGTGAGGWVVSWVGRAVMGFGLSRVGAGVVADDWLVPDIMPGMNAAMTIITLTAATATRPHFRKGLRLFFWSGTSLPSSGMPAKGVPGSVFSGDG